MADQRPLSGASSGFLTAVNTPMLGSKSELPLPSISDAPTPRDSHVPSLASKGSAPLLGNDEVKRGSVMEAAEDFSEKPQPQPQPRRRRFLPLLLVVVLIIVVLAVILPVYFVVIKNNNQRNSRSQSGSTPTSTPSSSGGNNRNIRATQGGDGSTVFTEDGSTFTYSNKYGGFWVDDPNDPFNDGAQCNSWTPPLNQSWNYQQNRIYGVNLGGLFVLEPFIAPSVWQKYPDAIDEWTLSQLMAADTGSGGLNQLEEHYKTFITEQDIAQIAGAGLNWVRIPIPYWAVETWPGEPFLAKTSWKYILRVIGWCRKYGLRVNLDLHTAPGGQNGYNHSGKVTVINFLHGVMGIANAQRTLEYIRVITEFISQPQYSNVVPMFGILNEALMGIITQDALKSFYAEAYRMMRAITGIGEGKGPFISIHDGFAGDWSGYMAGADRIAIDLHTYMAFDEVLTASPIDTGTGQGAGGVWPANACRRYAPLLNTNRNGFGFTYAGEWSNGFNDCGLFLKGVNLQSTYPGGCATWNDASTWTPAIKAGVMQFSLASMDALGDWFFWTWKVGNSTAGKVESPLWSYKHGLENGWMPTDPRVSTGTCGNLNVGGANFPQLQPWQTGGAGAGQVSETYAWPPASIVAAGGAAVARLPTYASTGTIVSLPPQTFTPKQGEPTPTRTVDVGSGWFNRQDTAGAPTPVSGCTYPNSWQAENVAVPAACGGGAGAGAGAAVPVPSVSATSARVPAAPATTSDPAALG